MITADDYFNGGKIKDPGNISKCREYRERSKVKKEQEVLDFQCQLSRNMKLKSDYDKKIDQIKILKAYYLKCLHNKSYKCLDQGIAGPSSDYPDSTFSIADEFTNVKTEVGDNQ